MLMRVKREGVVTYLFIFVMIGVAVGLLYALNLGLTGFAIFMGWRILKHRKKIHKRR